MILTPVPDVLVIDDGYPYTVTATLADYPTVTETDTDEITILNPCDEPFSLAIDPLHTVPSSDYSSPLVFEFPGFAVQPETCADEAVFTCFFDADNSPAYTGTENLCDNLLIPHPDGDTHVDGNPY